MPYVKGQLAPRQIEFLHRIEEGGKGVEEVLREMKIPGRTFGAWLQVGKFARRYQMAVRQLKARAEAMEASVKLHHAKRKLAGEEVETKLGEGESEAGKSGWETAMGRRVIELHGGEGAVEKMMEGETV